MTLIDGDRIITAQLYDEQHEEYIEKKMSIIDYVNAYTDEGVTETDVVEQTGWIPVSERLPKAGEYIGDVAKYYLVQNEYGDMMVARYTHSEYWEQIYRMQPIADEIVAWRELPKPYKAESEDKYGNI